MKKYTLLFIMLFAGIGSFAATVHGTVVNMSSAAVANQIVHVTDSSGGMQVFSIQDTTDATGNYSITIPATTPTGALLHVFTEKCGVRSTSLQTYSGSNITVNFTVCGNTSAGNTVSGTVTYVSATGSPAYPAIVYLIHKTYSSGHYVLTLLDSTNTASNGEYHFFGITHPAGDLLVKCALLSSNSNYWNYLPTYKESSITWSTAHAVSFTLGANDIHMVSGTNPGGPGFIGGSVLLGANKSAGVGDPLNNRIILLTTINDVAVAYTYSNVSGVFSFPNLAYGTYKLFGDVLGKDNAVTVVTIDGTHPSANNIVFQENSGSFSTTGISNPALFNSVVLYPNPVKDHLTISGLDKINGVKSVTLTTMTGASVVRLSVDGNMATVPVAQLPTGIYLLRVVTAEGAASYQIIK